MRNYPLFSEIVDLANTAPVAANRTRVLRARSFVIVMSEGDGSLPVDSLEEYFLLLPDAGARLESSGGTFDAPAHSVVVMPAGPSDACLLQPGACVRLFARAPAAFEAVAIFGDGAEGLPLRPVTPWRRSLPVSCPIIYTLDTLPNSPGMPRARLFQTSTLSINWVEYSGPRDRGNLSPHAHTDFEQASLALDGQFIHHFRTPWGRDADSWRPDEHVKADPGSVALIPPPIIHTSEGVGAGRHILIDIFSPPRADFIAKGQILNAAEYETGV